MPTLPPHKCATPGCPNLVSGAPRCPEHQQKHQLNSERARGTAAERGYDRAWAAARARYLREHPLCVHCLAKGRTTPARVVDHIRPHRGDQQLFWDESNWQSLCDYTSPFNCHGTKTSLEANERPRDDDATGGGV